MHQTNWLCRIQERSQTQLTTKLLFPLLSFTLIQRFVFRAVSLFRQHHLAIRCLPSGYAHRHRHRHRVSNAQHITLYACREWEPHNSYTHMTHSLRDVRRYCAQIVVIVAWFRNICEARVEICCVFDECAWIYLYIHIIRVTMYMCDAPLMYLCVCVCVCKRESVRLLASVICLLCR